MCCLQDTIQISIKWEMKVKGCDNDTKTLYGWKHAQKTDIFKTVISFSGSNEVCLYRTYPTQEYVWRTWAALTKLYISNDFHPDQQLKQSESKIPKKLLPENNAIHGKPFQ